MPGSSGPPVASIAGGGADAPVPGELGSFSWDGLTSDAPWLVPPAGIAAGPGAPLVMTLAPSFEQEAWSARWARIGADGADTEGTLDGGTGTTGQIAMTAPVAPGPWSLQVIASFADGGNAAWYWRITVAE